MNTSPDTEIRISPRRLRVAILTTDGVELDEVTRIEAALDRDGAETALVGPNRGRIVAYRGGSAVGELDVQVPLDSSDAKAFDALVIPGGVWQADALRSLTSAVTFVRAFAVAEKPIAVLGHAASLLIEADLAEGREVSGAPSLRTDLVNAGAEFIDRDVVQDGFVLSGRAVPAYYAALVEHIVTRRAQSARGNGPIAQFWTRLRGGGHVGEAAR
jgi:protease I